jgi:hypothetical protein
MKWQPSPHKRHMLVMKNRMWQASAALKKLLWFISFEWPGWLFWCEAAPFIAGVIVSSVELLPTWKWVYRRRLL